MIMCQKYFEKSGEKIWKWANDCFIFAPAFEK